MQQEKRIGDGEMYLNWPDQLQNFQTEFTFTLNFVVDVLLIQALSLLRQRKADTLINPYDEAVRVLFCLLSLLVTMGCCLFGSITQRIYALLEYIFLYFKNRSIRSNSEMTILH